MEGKTPASKKVAWGNLMNREELELKEKKVCPWVVGEVRKKKSDGCQLTERQSGSGPDRLCKNVNERVKKPKNQPAELA